MVNSFIVFNFQCFLIFYLRLYNSFLQTMSLPAAPLAAPSSITPQFQSHLQELFVGTRNTTQALDALRAQLSALSTTRARDRGATPQRNSVPDSSSPTPQPQPDDSPLKSLVDQVEHGIGEAEVRVRANLQYYALNHCSAEYMNLI